VMTSNREIVPSEGVVIVVIIGLRLCLISYAECPVEKGGSSEGGLDRSPFLLVIPLALGVLAISRWTIGIHWWSIPQPGDDLAVVAVEDEGDTR
jgi:hypothetical protein